MKPLVIYHAQCTDGFGAAFAAWLKLGDNAEYLPLRYNDPSWQEDVTPDISFKVQDREVYILDFSFSRVVMETLFQYAKRVVWLDHHKTAFEMWCPEFYAKPSKTHEYIESDLGYIRLHDGKSGAMLAWEYFHPGTEVPLFIRHIDDRDRWQFKMEGTKEFNAVIRSYEPGNVRWVTMAEQHRNQSNCRWIEFDGRTQLLTDWAKELGITDSTLHGRIKKWGIQQALSR